MKTYIGSVCDWNVRVKEDGKRTRKLPLKLNLFNHSPTGLAWGYGGSGPAQLALALLYDVSRDKTLAVEAHQDYKWSVIAKLPQDQGFELSEQSIQDWILSRKEKQADLGQNP